MHSLSAQHKRWRLERVCEASDGDVQRFYKLATAAREGATRRSLNHLGKPSFSLELELSQITKHALKCALHLRVKLCGTGEPLQHKARHAQVQQSFGRFRQALVVFAEPSRSPNWAKVFSATRPRRSLAGPQKRRHLREGARALRSIFTSRWAGLPGRRGRGRTSLDLA